jgi:hypothetical protein
MGWFWLFPDVLLPIVAAGLAIAVIVRALPFGRAVSILLGLLLAPVLMDAVVGIAFDALPTWMLVVGVLAASVQILRSVVGLVIGEDAASHVTGHLAALLVIGVFRLLLLPFRAAGWLLLRAIGG